MSSIHYFGSLSEIYVSLPEYVKSYSRVFILCDTNTATHCLPLIQEAILDFTQIVIPAGEEHKQIESVSHIWQQLTDEAADRHTLLINLGGGMISDIGGYAAGCYKRGIDFLNIPTTLLAMLDASVGGKVGINFQDIKNQIGLFVNPVGVMICDGFLATLPDRERCAGMAEALKHALIADAKLYQSIKSSKNWNDFITLDFIQRNIAIKESIVNQDSREQGIRKVLNYGHTIGHAMESLSMDTDTPLLHGEAVYIGMAVEAILSASCLHLSEAGAQDIVATIHSLYPLTIIDEAQMMDMIPYLLQDKKNNQQQIRMSLLPAIGTCSYDIVVAEHEIIEAIDTYNSLL